MNVACMFSVGKITLGEIRLSEIALGDIEIYLYHVL
jgi:hypothetical protein